MLHQDEVRAFIHMLKLVEAILPCPLCQKHYRSWRTKHPLEFPGSPTAFYEAARNWLWKLHDTINEERGVARPSLEEATELNKQKDFQQSLKALLEVLEQAKLQRLIDGAHVREWLQRLTHLRRFIRV
jgi:hypothetical protein